MRRLSAILAADVVGFSRLMEADEVATLDLYSRYRRDVIDRAVAEFQGRLVKETGDGLLLEFASVVSALECAAKIQTALLEKNRPLADGKRIELRIGIHLGDVLVEKEDIFGDDVNIAVRIEGLARPGGIALSSAAREQVGKKLGLSFEDGGEQQLKNIERPLRIYHVAVGSAPEETPQQTKRTSIAVLPFTNMSGDPEQEYFADGITEDLITDLSKISALFVVGRNSVFTYKGKAVKLPQIAKELGVGLLLEGSVRKAAQRVRITAQLIDGASGGHLWADRYDRDLTDIFALQDEITHTIVDQLKVRILPTESAAIAKPATHSVEAYTYYLKARQYQHYRTKPALYLARRMLERAIALDANYAQAHAAIADCDTLLNSWHGVPIPISDLLASADKALSLNPTLAEAHAARGQALLVAQRTEEAVQEFEKALQLNPEGYEANMFYAEFCFGRRDFEKAEQLYIRAMAAQPEGYRAPIHLSKLYRALGRPDDRLRAARIALQAAEAELRRHPDTANAYSMGGVALAILGEKDRAREWNTRAELLDPDDNTRLYISACIHTLLGEHDKAIENLLAYLPKVAASEQLWFLQDEDFTDLRGQPDYHRIEALLRS